MSIETTYECPVHKIMQQGLKRENFQNDYYNLLMNLQMGESMKLYKEVNVACDCQSNYQIFDKIKNSSAEIKNNM